MSGKITTIAEHEREKMASDELGEFIRAELCTEKKAAKVFAKDFGAGVRWTPEWGWLSFDGICWRRDRSGEVFVLAETVSEYFRQEAMSAHCRRADEKLVKAILAFARRCESARGIADFLKLAQPILFQPVEDFDTHPWKVNFENITLDFETLDGDLPRQLKHGSADYITKAVPYDWSMDAPRNRWDKFLAEIFPSDDLRNFIQRAVGYSLLGITSEQCFFIAYGGGCNGKSVFLNVLLRVLGQDYAQQADPQSFMQQQNEGIRTDLADLRGVRLVSAIETGDGKRLDEAIVKQATGGDPIRARHLYKEAFQFRPEFSLWLATNHRPRIYGTDFAIWRRVRLIPFEVTIPEEQRDGDLEDRLVREAEGILDWAVEGAVSYRKNGLQAPAEVLAATEQYRTSEDVIGQFIEDRCYAANTAFCTKGDLYKAYKEWAENQGERPVSQKRFGMAIQERGFDEYRSERERNWQGIGIS
jgi:putative DNA primase/helicase